MFVKVFNKKSIFIINKVGELVCVKPFPSRPTNFWGDKGDLKYNKSYMSNQT